MPNVWVLAGGRFQRDTAGCVRVTLSPGSRDMLADFAGRVRVHLHQYPLQSTHVHPHDRRGDIPASSKSWVIAVCFSRRPDTRQKYPLSPITYWVERHSALAAPFAWGLAFAHSGAWWAHAGWAQSGPLCYYAPKVLIGGLDSRDLVQFIPRAFVFLTIIVLYSMLYKFLRRPDTIQLSSQFVSGETGHAGSAGQTHRKGILGNFKWRSKKGGCALAGQNGAVPSASRIDPNAPWEQLEFVQIGGRNVFSQSASALNFSPTASVNYTPTAQPEWRPATPPLIGTARMQSTLEPTPGPEHRPSLTSILSDNTELRTPLYPPNTQRTSDTTLVSTPVPHLRFEPDSRSQHLDPVLSQPERKSGPWRDHDIELDLGPEIVGTLGKDDREDGDDSDATPDAQTMKEFFNDDVVSRPAGPDNHAERGMTSNNPPQMSATAYFNRQASMLMLYFPLAVSETVPQNRRTKG